MDRLGLSPRRRLLARVVDESPGLPPREGAALRPRPRRAGLGRRGGTGGIQEIRRVCRSGATGAAGNIRNHSHLKLPGGSSLTPIPGLVARCSLNRPLELLQCVQEGYGSEGARPPTNLRWGSAKAWPQWASCPPTRRADSGGVHWTRRAARCSGCGSEPLQPADGHARDGPQRGLSAPVHPRRHAPRPGRTRTARPWLSTGTVTPTCSGTRGRHGRKGSETAR